LLDHLKERQVDKVVIGGMMTHMCVEATARAAFDYGLEVIVVHDACATRNLSFQDHLIPAEQVQMAFLSALSFIYARVMSTSDFLRNFHQ
jgi:nicotinamidase-related amidase